MASSKKSVARIATPFKGVEIIDGNKFICKIYTTGNKTFTIIKGDKLVVVRRKKVLYPK